jgi:hypothetical protein
MRELSEQEQLARLVRGNDEDKTIDSAGLLEASLKNSLGSVSSERLSKIKEEIEAHGDIPEGRKLKSLAEKEKEAVSYSTEKLMLELYDVRDELISIFEISGINTNMSKKVEQSIAKIEQCLQVIGGDVDKFVPLNHLSGLDIPDFQKNAEQVIKTTKQCYRLGKIETAKINDNGKSIQIVFSGTDGDTEYIADGIITAEEWVGNEAIDYIYTPGEGNMTVKAFENGRWVLKAGNKYKVLWDLKEKEINAKIVENKKEVENKLQNNMDIEEEIGDFIS